MMRTDHSPHPARTLRHLAVLLAAAAAAAVTLGLTAASGGEPTVQPAEPADLEPICGPGPIPTARMADVDGSAHADAVDCLAWIGAVHGTTHTTFEPHRDVARDQLASLLWRSLTHAEAFVGPVLDEPADGAFADVAAASPHRQAVDALAAIDVARGVSAELFDPHAPIRRDQAASLVARAIDPHLAPLEGPAGTPFADVDDDATHAEAIAALAEAGIVVGDDGTFDPDGLLTRGQAASLVARALAWAAERTDLAPLPQPGVDGVVRAGASRVSIEPRDDRWQTEGCEGWLPHQEPTTRDCLYTGGYDIGAVNPIEVWDDDVGLHARAVAIDDGQRAWAMVVLDVTGWFARYTPEFCDGCGARDVAERVAERTGLPDEAVWVANTHTHTGPDLMGAWGGVPDWYWDEVVAATEQALVEAITDLRPAVLHAGEVDADQFNRERRNTYESDEEPELAWLRADRLEPTGEPAGEAVVSVAGYAAHPTTVGEDPWLAHADWPGLLARDLEDRFGGVGVGVVTGLGNKSASGGTQIGAELAGLVPAEPTTDELVEQPTVEVAASSWSQPVTNDLLMSLSDMGVFARAGFTEDPTSITTDRPQGGACTSEGPVGIDVHVAAARIGELTLTGAPGELFAATTNSFRDLAGSPILPMSQVDDAMGYPVPSAEWHPDSQGHPDGEEYEELFGLDECFGDAIWAETVGLIDQLGG